MRKILDAIHVPNWVVGILALVLILRIPTFFEPYYYGDEMVYLTLGEGIRQGIGLYSGLHDNKPPLIYIVAAIAGSLTAFKIILAFWGLGTVILFWKLSNALFPDKFKLQKVATFIFVVLTTLPLLEGNTINSELFMIGPTILGFLILFTRKRTIKNLVLAGIFFSIATLFKVSAAFDAPAIIVFWIITSGFKNWRVVSKNSFYLLLGFLSPILVTFVWFLSKGTFPDYIKAVFFQNIGYLSSFRPGDREMPFLVRNAPLLIRGLIVLVGSGILYLRRRLLSRKFIFITLWLLFSLFAVTLSERPYPHYLIQSVAPISFLLAILFTDKTFRQVAVIVPISLAFFVPVYYKFYYYSTPAYYLRFLEFASHRISQEEYFAKFDKNVNRNYKISEFITTSIPKHSKVFIWEDSPTIYTLSRHLPPIKYVAGYHINDFSDRKEVAGQLAKTKPKFIILLGDSSFPELTPIVKDSYVLINNIEGAEIWSRFR